MDIFAILKSIGALILVIGVIGLIYLFMKKFSLDKLHSFSNASSKIKIDEIKLIDPSRKIACVSYNKKRYLLLLGSNDLLLEKLENEE